MGGRSYSNSQLFKYIIVILIIHLLIEFILKHFCRATACHFCVFLNEVFFLHCKLYLKKQHLTQLITKL